MAFADQSIGAFLAAVASEDLTPSGGAVAAIAGAAGAALCEMACRHTSGNDGDANENAELAGLARDLEADRRRLLELADADAAAVEAVFHGTNETKADDPAERATEVPLEIAEASLEVLGCAETVAANSNPRAVPDAATGAFLAHAAVQATTSTVRVNLAALDDEAFVTTTRERTDDVERAAAAALERVEAALETP